MPARNRASCFSPRCSWAPGHVSPPAAPALPGVVPVSLGCPQPPSHPGSTSASLGQEPNDTCGLPGPWEGPEAQDRRPGRPHSRSAGDDSTRTGAGRQNLSTPAISTQRKKGMDNLPFLKVSVTSGHQPLKNCSVTMWSPPSEMETFRVIPPLFHPDLRARDASAVRAHRCQAVKRLQAVREPTLLPPPAGRPHTL